MQLLIYNKKITVVTYLQKKDKCKDLFAIKIWLQWLICKKKKKDNCSDLFAIKKIAAVTYLQ